MIFKIEDVTLVNIKPVFLNERERNDKGEWVKTDKKREMTEYLLSDEFGERISFLSAKDFRSLEGKTGLSVEIDVKYNDFERKNKMTLNSIAEN